MDNVNFKTRKEGEVSFIEVNSDLDNESSGEALRIAFNSLADRGNKTIVLDLDKVEIINSYGLGKILMCYKRLKVEDGVLMVTPLKGFLKEVFELLMLDSLFPVYENDENKVSS
jgi:anti-anti-sigma factor